MKAFKLVAPLKDYIWGGTRLRDEYGKKSDLERIAESWELSCHKDGMCIISGGEYDGRPLSDFISDHPEALGMNVITKFSDFPVLIKLIDARDNLSVQVHPNDRYAMRVEHGYGKTEMWYVVDCEPDAELIYGFKENITKKEFRNAIENNTLLDKVNRVPVKKGDVFFIKAGTLHAIGKGILIAEIQQNSNTTYRVYDYNRKDSNGNTRELHIKKAVDVTKLQASRLPEKDSESPYLAKCKYFKVFREDVDGCSSWHKKNGSFTHILVLDGEGTLFVNENTVTENMKFTKGESIFIPAGLRWSINGKCSTICTVI